MFKSRNWPEWLFWIVLILIYLLSRNPYPEFGDSLGFIYYASIGFDWATNATSHFLYANFNHLMVLVLPFLSPVFILSMLSLLFGLLSVWQLRLMGRAVGLNQGAALFAAAIFALSFSWWRQVVTIEVYAMQLFLVLRMLLLMLRDEQDGTYTRSWWVFILYGLALLTHIQNILLAPLLLIYWWRGRSRGIALASPVAGVILFSILMLLPPILGTHGWKAVFVDRQFAGEVMQFDPLIILKGFARSIGYLGYNFHLFIIPIGYGIWLWLRQGQAWMLALLGSTLIFWLFAMRYNVNDNYVFFLLPYAILALAGGQAWQQWFAERRWYRMSYTLAVVSILLYAGSVFTLQQIEKAERWAKPKAYKGGIAYYLWPGRSNAPNPIQLAKEIEEGKRETIADFDRYEMALKVGNVLDSP